MHNPGQFSGEESLTKYSSKADGTISDKTCYKRAANRFQKRQLEDLKSEPNQLSNNSSLLQLKNRCFSN